MSKTRLPFLREKWALDNEKSISKLLDKMKYGLYADCRNIKRFLLLVVV